MGRPGFIGSRLLVIVLDYFLMPLLAAVLLGSAAKIRRHRRASSVV
jgi:hypothetical protein